MDLVPKEYKQNNIAPPEESKKISWQVLKDKITSEKTIKAFIISGFLILFLLVSGWGGLKVYQSRLEKEVDSLKKTYGQFFDQEKKRQAEDIIDQNRRLNILADLWKKHVYSSYLFAVLGDATLPKVQWSDLNLDVTKKSMSLEGLALNYEILAKQILALQETGFSKLEVGDIGLDKEGGVSFFISFEFPAKFLQAEQSPADSENKNK